MNVWITGGAGFLGTYVASALRALGHKTIGLSRRPSAASDISLCVDLSSSAAPIVLREAAERHSPDVIVHTASLLPGSNATPDYVRANVLTTANLLEFAGKQPPRQVIYTSTLSVYGRPDSNPVAETVVARADFPYAITKRWGEQLIEMFADRGQVIVLRLPSLYGRGQADSFIDGLARLALNNDVIELFARGAIARDALHVTDVVRAIVSCIEHAPAGQIRYFNLGVGRRITGAEYAETLVKTLGSNSPIVPVDRPSSLPFDLYADITEARRSINFIPTPLQESLNAYARELRT